MTESPEGGKVDEFDERDEQVCFPLLISTSKTYGGDSG